jgi:hypothetical protein
MALYFVLSETGPSDFRTAHGAPPHFTYIPLIMTLDDYEGEATELLETYGEFAIDIFLQTQLSEPSC